MKYWMKSSVMIVLLAYLPWIGASGQNIDDLLSLSGVDRKLVELQLTAWGAVEGLSEETLVIFDKEALVGNISKAINPEAMLMKVREALFEKMNEDEIDILLSWYNSELALRLKACEEQGVTMEEFQYLMDNFSQVLEDDKERHALAQRINAAFKVYEIVTAFDTFSHKLVLNSLLQQVGQAQTLDSDLALLQADSDNKENFDIMDASFVYIMRSVSLEDLKAFAAFAVTPACDKFSSVIRDAFSEALDSSLESINNKDSEDRVLIASDCNSCCR